MSSGKNMEGSETVRCDARRLVEWLSIIPRPVVAFSGGVDSAVVAKAAFEARGPKALAVTGIGKAVSQADRETARKVARHIGIPHREVATDELANSDYVANNADRCYHCKSELYGSIWEAIRQELGEEEKSAVILSGANRDDWEDHRPGLVAAEEAGVRHPLAELGWGKNRVRAVAWYWELPVWDKPASPCLASRLAYGVEVTAERLAMVERAEAFLRDEGLRELRVRYHPGDLARIEVPLECLEQLCREECRTRLVKCLKELGFRSVTLDLEGLRSGNLNELIEVDQLARWQEKLGRP